MADKTKIEWAEASWNPFRGCTRVSPGCQNCYAERMAARGLPGYLSPTTGLPFASMTPSGPHWRNVAIADMERLDKVERLRLDVDWSEFGQWTAWGLTSRPACASTARAAIDGVTE